MRKGHNIITTMPWLYLELNERLLRIDSEDSFNIYSWRETKTKPSYWFKIKPSKRVGINGYISHLVSLKKDKIKHQYLLSRIVYKAHNPDWDITDTSQNNFIDHINKTSADNRIENLRILTHQQNQFNTRARGYYWDKENNKWRVEITLNGKKINIGRFIEEADAHQAYLTAKEKYHIMPI